MKSAGERVVPGGCIIQRRSGTGKMDRRTFLSHSGQLLALAQFAPGMFVENPMPERPQRRNLSFSNDWIESMLMTAVRDMPVEDAIVVQVLPEVVEVPG